jgi:acid phosphatase
VKAKLTPLAATLLASDISNNNMPAYSFYTPNITNDGHDSSASFAGTWLVNFLNSTLNDAAFMQDALVLITFDENASTNKRNQVWSCLIGGVIPDNLKGTTDDTFYTHYSALHTVELNWGLGSLGRGDANQTLANVFEFAAGALGYENVAVNPVPLMNTAISGLLTGQSWNETNP